MKRIDIKLKKFYLIVLKDPERKSLFKIFLEYSKLLLFNRDLSAIYFQKFLYHQKVKNINDYLITDRLQKRIWKLNDQLFLSLLDDKRRFENYFLSQGINVVRNYGYNKKIFFFVENKKIKVTNYDGFIKIIVRIFDENKDTDSIFVKKSANSFGGSDIYKISLSEIDNRDNGLKHIYKKIIQSEYLIQKRIAQHRLMDKLNPNCVNTIRINTYINGKKECKVLSSVLRVGAGASPIDNVSSGGFHIGINHSHGSVCPEAYSIFKIGHRGTILRHPETGIEFKDFEIPFYKDAVNLAINAAKKIPQLRIIGWDIAIQPDGPIIIEGNSRPSLYHSETVNRGYKNNSVFQVLIKEI